MAESAANLQQGLPDAKFDLEVAFYAHHLHRGTPQGAADDPATLEPEAQEFVVNWVESLRPAIPQGPRTARARQTVADAIDRHRPEVVVAHSLGSVVTYETLWAHPGPDVELLVTLGAHSPCRASCSPDWSLAPTRAGSRPASDAG